MEIKKHIEKFISILNTHTNKYNLDIRYENNKIFIKNEYYEFFYHKILREIIFLFE